MKSFFINDELFLQFHFMILDTLIHDVDTNACESLREVLDDMKWINSHFTVFQVLHTDVSVRFPHIDGDVSDTITFVLRNGLKIA